MSQWERPDQYELMALVPLYSLRDAISANRQAIIEHVAAVAGIDIGPEVGHE
jgi:hypothetical protein